MQASVSIHFFLFKKTSSSSCHVALCYHFALQFTMFCNLRHAIYSNLNTQTVNTKYTLCFCTLVVRKTGSLLHVKERFLSTNLVDKARVKFIFKMLRNRQRHQTTMKHHKHWLTVIQIISIANAVWIYNFFYKVQ